MSRPLRIAVLAGEESGDRLGAALVQEISRRIEQQETAAWSGVIVGGVGGEALAACGQESAFPMDDISLMGITAVIKRLPNLLVRLRQAVRHLEDFKPDCVIVVDAPDFNLRVAKRYRKIAPNVPIIKWVSPTVWAWRPGRAKAMTAYIDHILAILPFEPEVHRELGGPPCSYVGHPLMDQVDALTPGPDERIPFDEAHERILLVLPGSRHSEVSKLMQPMGEAVADLKRQGYAIRVILPTIARREAEVRKLASTWGYPPEIVVGEAEKLKAFRSAHAALAASGTVTLELALAGVPLIAIYKSDWIIRFFISRYIRPWTILLPNLVIGRPAVREFIDGYIRPNMLARVVGTLLVDTPERRALVQSLEEIRSTMRGSGASSSKLAADVVLDLVASRRDPD